MVSRKHRKQHSYHYVNELKQDIQAGLTGLHYIFILKLIQSLDWKYSNTIASFILILNEFHTLAYPSK